MGTNGNTRCVFPTPAACVSPAQFQPTPTHSQARDPRPTPSWPRGVPTPFAPCRGLLGGKAAALPPVPLPAACPKHSPQPRDPTQPNPAPPGPAPPLAASPPLPPSQPWPSLYPPARPLPRRTPHSPSETPHTSSSSAAPETLRPLPRPCSGLTPHLSGRGLSGQTRTEEGEEGERRQDKSGQVRAKQGRTPLPLLSAPPPPSTPRGFSPRYPRGSPSPAR
ncbi:vegetative cell wall protein gp1-like [Calypte anna]|uniref:vegetative cell wall protein gp1-like n=1 Tax=Calypte anna TaxID=9244 RepID=UPI0011C43177|nr:vegetative cell wall protein gp1-like [Calypte anna]